MTASCDLDAEETALLARLQDLKQAREERCLAALDQARADLAAAQAQYQARVAELRRLVPVDAFALAWEDRVTFSNGRLNATATARKCRVPYRQLTRWAQQHHPDEVVTATEETKRKISEAQRGRKFTDEHRQRMREAQLARRVQERALKHQS